MVSDFRKQSHFRNLETKHGFLVVGKHLSRTILSCFQHKLGENTVLYTFLDFRRDVHFEYAYKLYHGSQRCSNFKSQ